MIRWSKIFKYDGDVPAYTDYTSNQKLDSSISFLDAAADYWYFGSDRRTTGMMVELSTNGDYGTFTYSYWNGAWSQLSMISSYDFDSTKYAIWVLPEDASTRTFTATDPHAATPPDTEADLYWVRLSVDVVTSAAVISKFRAIPYNTYATHQDVSNMLQLKEPFDTSKQPYPHSVEKMIRRVEDRIDYITRKSWRFNYEVNEEHDFNINGIRMNHFPIIDVYTMQIYDGSSWETKTEGRSSDYFTIDALGVLKYSRYYLLPARFAYIPALTGRWGVGEFFYPMRISYSWGRDLEIDHEFMIVNDICSKMVAMDLVNSLDYTTLTRSGIDKVTMDRKIENWKEDTNEKLSELQSVVIF